MLARRAVLQRLAALPLATILADPKLARAAAALALTFPRRILD